MSGYTPATDPKPRPARRAHRRPCGFTRPELSELRTLSGRRKPHNLRDWLHQQTSAIMGSVYLSNRFAAALRHAESGSAPRTIGQGAARGQSPKGIKNSFKPLSTCSYRV